MIAMERVPQPVLEHRVDEFQSAHFGAVAQMRGMGGQAHTLHPARGDDGAFAGADLLGAQSDGAEAGAADLVDAEGGVGVRHAGGAGRLPGRILSATGGQNLAKYHLVHLPAFDPGAGESGAQGDGTQFMRGKGAECAVEAADRCPRGGDDDDVVHDGALPMGGPSRQDFECSAASHNQKGATARVRRRRVRVTIQSRIGAHSTDGARRPAVMPT